MFLKQLLSSSPNERKFRLKRKKMWRREQKQKGSIWTGAKKRWKERKCVPVVCINEHFGWKVVKSNTLRCAGGLPRFCSSSFWYSQENCTLILKFWSLPCSITISFGFHLLSQSSFSAQKVFHIGFYPEFQPQVQVPGLYLFTQHYLWVITQNQSLGGITFK